jgi:hypothetical protein
MTEFLPPQQTGGSWRRTLTAGYFGLSPITTVL